MRLRVILQEAVRDVASGTSRVAILTAAFCLFAIPLACVEALTVAGILEGAERYASSGGATRILSGSDGGSISAQGCEAVGADRANLHSGGLRSTSPMVFDELPDNRVLQFEISSTFLAVLGSPAPPGGGLWGVVAARSHTSDWRRLPTSRAGEVRLNRWRLRLPR